MGRDTVEAAAARSVANFSRLPGIGREHEEQLREIYNLLPPPDISSHEERLDRVVHDTTDAGEEILCDYLAAEVVTQLLGPQGIPCDEILLACFVASLHIQLLREVDGIIDLHNVQTHEIVDVVDHYMAESEMRRQLFSFTCHSLSMRDHLLELDRLSISDEDYEKAQYD